MCICAVFRQSHWTWYTAILESVYIHCTYLYVEKDVHFQTVTYLHVCVILQLNTEYVVVATAKKSPRHNTPWDVLHVEIVVVNMQ